MKNITLLVLGIFSLSVGGLIYIVFRPDTLIHTLVSSFMPLPRECICQNSFIRFYLPDALWAFSLGCFLSTLLENRLIFALIVAGYGIAWELAQALSIISGTADLIDVGMYVIAALAVVGINLLFKENPK